MAHKQQSILFVCNTAFQVLVATHLRMTLYSDDNADIIVTDHTHGMEKVVNGLKASGLYRSTLVSNCLETEKAKRFIPRIQKIRWLLHPHRTMQYLDSPLASVYDILCVSNLNLMAGQLYTHLKANNPALRAVFAEEGYVQYYSMPAMPIMQRLFHFRAKLFHTPNLFAEITCLYLFHPELIQYDPGVSVLPMPALCTVPGEHEALNLIFAYDQLTDNYHKKFILLEDVLETDQPRGDEALLRAFIQAAGSENVILKPHPRNTVNRFADTGVSIAHDTSVPFEIICMNLDLSNTSLVCVSTGSALTPSLLFQLRPQTYLLYPCLSEELPSVTSMFQSFANIMQADNGLHNIHTITDLPALLSALFGSPPTPSENKPFKYASTKTGGAA